MAVRADSLRESHRQRALEELLGRHQAALLDLLVPYNQFWTLQERFQNAALANLNAEHSKGLHPLICMERQQIQFLVA